MSRLTAHDLGFTYPGCRAEVLTSVGFSAEPGETIAVVGSSGAGKTTLLRCLARIARPTVGSVSLGGEDLFGRAGRKRLAGAVGFVHQQHAIPSALTVEMAVLGGRLWSWGAWKTLRTAWFGPSKDDAAAVREVLAQVGLEDAEGSLVGELSVGQRQRVAVARTLLQDPWLIVADEPVASVDASTAEVVLCTLAEAAAEGAIVVCSMHDLERARTHFSRIIGLRDGRIAFDVKTAEMTTALAALVYEEAA